MKKIVVSIVGPTGVGKSDTSIALAQLLSAPIVSSDSRQIYKQMTIGTAVPSKEQLSAVQHYFIQTVDVTSFYSAGDYQRDAIALIDELFKTYDYVLLVGGSGLYIDAVCKGIDEMPSCSEQTREFYKRRIEVGELPLMVQELQEKDPDYYEIVDKSNPQRISRALEVISESGRSYTSFRTGEGQKRDFEVRTIGITRPREELYERINKRVDQMMSEGLLEEATALYPLRNYNALQTVGYREFFDYIDGKRTLGEAIDLLKQNTRRYAKRQMTWFRRDETIKWFSPNDLDNIADYLKISCKK